MTNPTKLVLLILTNLEAWLSNGPAGERANAGLRGGDHWRANLQGCIITPKELHAVFGCRRETA